MELRIEVCRTVQAREQRISAEWTHEPEKAAYYAAEAKRWGDEADELADAIEDTVFLPSTCPCGSGGEFVSASYDCHCQNDE